MNEDNVVTFRQPGEIDDALTEVLRAGARPLLAQAVNAEVAAFLAEHSALKLDNGRQRVVRHGHAPEWMIRTGIGPLTVAPPRVRDWGAAVDDRIRFTSGDLAAMGAPDQERGALLPVLYLRGLSSGDFRGALTALLDKEADALSPSVIARLKAEWAEDLARWERRGLWARSYVYLWADGVCLQARQDADAQYVLLLSGGHAGGQEGAGRLHRRLLRERPILAPFEWKKPAAEDHPGRPIRQQDQSRGTPKPPPEKLLPQRLPPYLPTLRASLSSSANGLRLKAVSRSPPAPIHSQLLPGKR